MSLIQKSLVASVLIIGIVLFRLVFVRRIPKRVMMVLWGIVVLRLVLPGSVPLPYAGSGVVITHVQPGYAETEVTITASEDSGQQEVESVGSAEKLIFIVEMLAEKNWSKALTAVYLAGTFVMLLGSVYLYVRDGRFFRESLPMGEKERNYLIWQLVPGERERKYLKKVRFRVSDRTATPVTCGVLKPAVVFPKGIFLKEEKEVGFCLLHELVHIRNHDNLRKLIVHAVLCFYWFNPLVWVMHFLVNRDMELLCDEMAVRKCRADRQDYALALLSLAERRTVGFRTALGFGKNAVKERILAVMSAGRPTVGGVAASFLAVALAVTVFLCSQMVMVVAGSEIAAEYAITTDSVAEYGSAGEDEIINSIYYEGEAQSAEATMDIVEADVMADAETGMILEAAEDTRLPAEMVIVLQNLAGEFEGMGLQVQINSDDYQLYFKGTPVYFFADNQNQEDEGFSGRVYAREAGNGNGDTGVATVRDEDGVIIGLVNLSEEESRQVARAWTGMR